MTEILLVLAALFLAQLVKGVIGFGSALVGIPLISLVYAPADAIAITLVVDVVAGLYLVFQARALILWRRTAAIVLTMLPGQWLGTGLLEILPVREARMVLSVVVAIMAARILRGTAVNETAETPAGMVPWGGVAAVSAGMMQGVVGMPGPPLVAWCSRYLPGPEARATLLSCFLPAALTTLAMLSARGMAPPEQLWTGAWMAPVSLTGGVLGAFIAPRLSVVWFRRAVATVLLISALALLLG